MEKVQERRELQTAAYAFLLNRVAFALADLSRFVEKDEEFRTEVEEGFQLKVCGKNVEDLPAHYFEVRRHPLTLIKARRIRKVVVVKEEDKLFEASAVVLCIVLAIGLLLVKLLVG